MKTLYLDIFSGISGDMFIGAMIDLGVDAHALEHALEKLKLDGGHIHVARGQKANIAGVKFDVQLAHTHEHTHQDRKSTRLNSSHLVISYAVFCLKKKKTKTNYNTRL